MVAVELDGVEKRYRVYKQKYRSLKDVLFHRSFGEWEDRWALRGLDLTIEPGQTLGLIGSNGAGKSTTLKLVARILVPDHGEVRTAGRVSGLLELGAGFQAEYTGRENLYLNASLLGLNRREISDRFDAIVDFAELAEHIDDPVRTYSSGMYMRLGFAIAVHVQPEILLVDEVFAVGDEAFQRKCLDWMDGFKKAGGTVVLVSHNLAAVRELCTVAAWIEAGRLQEVGEPAAVTDAYVEWVRAGRGSLSAERQPGGAGGAHGGEAQRAVDLGEVLLLDRAGKLASQLRSGDPLTVEIPYSVNRPVERPMFGVAIHRDDGLYVFGTNTSLAGTEVASLDKAGVVWVRYPAINLLPGTYRVTVSVFGSTAPNAEPIDSHWQRYSFRMVGGGHEEGVVQLDHQWEFGQPDARLDRRGA